MVIHKVVGATSLLKSMPMKSVTYEQLISIMQANQLKEGLHYKIIDYRTKHQITNTTDFNVAEIEPLIVTAISHNKIAVEAYSENYPQDIIYYHIDNNQSLVPGCDRGYISRRIDTLQNNDFPFDFRHVKFRRWQLNVTDVWSASVTYQRGAVVKRSLNSNEIYISLKDSNLNKSVANREFWRLFEFQNGEFVSPFESEWVILSLFEIIIPCSEAYMNYCFFKEDTFYNTAFNNKINDIGKINTINTVVFGKNFSNNSIGGDFSNNSISEGFSYNSIGEGFYYNSIGTGFYNNSIGANFSNNSISAGFYYNSIGANFSNNSISEGFSYNSIGEGFYYNSIGTGFYYNSIGAGFYNNSIGAGFYYNSIDNYFRKNDIKNQTCQLIDFSTATHVYGNYDTTILKRADGTVVLTYYNNSANLVMVDVNS